jgi:hypothetical protein
MFCPHHQLLTGLAFGGPELISCRLVARPGEMAEWPNVPVSKTGAFRLDLAPRSIATKHGVIRDVTIEAVDNGRYCHPIEHTVNEIRRHGCSQFSARRSTRPEPVAPSSLLASTDSPKRCPRFSSREDSRHSNVVSRTVRYARAPHQRADLPRFPESVLRVFMLVGDRCGQRWRLDHRSGCLAYAGLPLLRRTSSGQLSPARDFE